MVASKTRVALIQGRTILGFTVSQNAIAYAYISNLMYDFLVEQKAVMLHPRINMSL